MVLKNVIFLVLPDNFYNFFKMFLYKIKTKKKYRSLHKKVTLNKKVYGPKLINNNFIVDIWSETLSNQFIKHGKKSFALRNIKKLLTVYVKNFNEIKKTFSVIQLREGHLKPEFIISHLKKMFPPFSPEMELEWINSLYTKIKKNKNAEMSKDSTFLETGKKSLIDFYNRCLTIRPTENEIPLNFLRYRRVTIRQHYPRFFFNSRLFLFLITKICKKNNYNQITKTFISQNNKNFFYKKNSKSNEKKLFKKTINFDKKKFKTKNKFDFFFFYYIKNFVKNKTKKKETFLNFHNFYWTFFKKKFIQNKNIQKKYDYSSFITNTENEETVEGEQVMFEQKWNTKKKVTPKKKIIFSEKLFNKNNIFNWFTKKNKLKLYFRSTHETNPKVIYKIIQVQTFAIKMETEEEENNQTIGRFLFLEKNYSNVSYPSVLNDIFSFLVPSVKLTTSMVGHKSKRRLNFITKNEASLEERRKIIFKWLKEFVNKNPKYNHLIRNTERKPASKKIHLKPISSKRLIYPFNFRLSKELYTILNFEPKIQETLNEFQENTKSYISKKHYRWDK